MGNPEITNKEAIVVLQTFRQVFDRDGVEHRELLIAAIDRSIQSLLKVEELNIEYQIYHFDDEYWRGVKHALGFFNIDEI